MFKEIFSIIFEILFSIFIIIIGYFIWDNFDQTDYKTAQYYDNIKDVDLIYESDADNNIEGNNVVVSIHNISDELNNKNVILKINKESNFSYIKINNSYYNLNEIFMSNDDLYNYYLIENVDLDGYETKVYYIDMIDNSFTDYEFVTEL